MKITEHAAQVRTLPAAHPLEPWFNRRKELHRGRSFTIELWNP